MRELAALEYAQVCTLALLQTVLASSRDKFSCLVLFGPNGAETIGRCVHRSLDLAQGARLPPKRGARDV